MGYAVSEYWSLICYFGFLVCIGSSSVSLESQIFLFWYLLGEYIVSVLFSITLHSIVYFARKDKKIVIFTCYYWPLVSIIYN